MLKNPESDWLKQIEPDLIYALSNGDKTKSFASSCVAEIYGGDFGRIITGDPIDRDGYLPCALRIVALCGEELKSLTVAFYCGPRQVRSYSRTLDNRVAALKVARLGKPAEEYFREVASEKGAFVLSAYEMLRNPKGKSIYQIRYPEIFLETLLNNSYPGEEYKRKAMETMCQGAFLFLKSVRGESEKVILGRPNGLEFNEVLE